MAEDFKQFELEGWELSADQYDASFSRLTRQIMPRILDVLEIKQGTRFLDIACGPGYLADLARQRGAQAVGVDFSAAMIERARQRFPSIHFEIGDAEKLVGFASDSCDAAGMNFGILHLAHPEKAIRAMHRVLVAGGRAAFTVWAKPDQALGFGIMLDAIAQHGDPTIPLPSGPAFFQYSGPEECQKLLERYGFSSKVETLDLQWKLRDADELFAAFFHGTARTGGLLRRQRTEDLANIRAALDRAVAAFMNQGELVIPMPAQLAWGVKKLVASKDPRADAPAH